MQKLVRLVPFLFFTFVSSSLGQSSARPVLPLRFEENRGQAPQQFSHVAHAGGTGILFRRDGFVLRSPKKDTVTVGLAGASETSPVAESETGAVSNYLRGNDRSKWITGVQQFDKLRYHEIYPGIDLLFYGNENRFEHDFIVEPGADYQQIRLQLGSAVKARLDANGDVVIGSGRSELRLKKPVTYQLEEKKRVERESRFLLVANTLRFDVPSYDRSKTLYIDPVFIFSTFVGSDQGDLLVSSVTGPPGSSYVMGQTWQATFPATSSAFQTVCASCPNNPDIYVVKLNAAGSQMEYATYIGGADYDWPRGMAVDANGNVAVVGTTRSQDFPSVNPMFTVPAGYAPDWGFVLSLNASGSALNFSSRMPASTNAVAAAFDPAGNLYVAGTTHDQSFPITPGTLPVGAPGYPNNDMFAVKVATDGTIAYSAIIQHVKSISIPPDAPQIAGISADASGNLLIVGTAVDGLPTTPGSLQPQIGTTQLFGRNAFALKLNTQASQLVFSTYLGSESGSTAWGATTSPGGSIVIVGNSGMDFPVTSGAYTFSNPGINGFIAMLSSDGTTLQHATLLPGMPSSVAVASDGKIYVGGWTSGDVPLIRPIQTQVPASYANRAPYLLGFSADLSQLSFSTYFPGTASAPLTLSTDPSGHLFVGGTATFDFPTTLGSLKPSVPAPTQGLGPLYGIVAAIDVAAPSPAVCLSSNDASFSATVGKSVVSNISIKNCGDADLNVTNVALDNSTSGFSQVNDCIGGSIAPGASCTVQVTFSPTIHGIVTATLTLTDNAPLQVQKAMLTGIGRQAVLEKIEFQNIPPTVVGTTVGERMWFLGNQGDAYMHVNSVTLSPNPDFTIRTDCNPSQAIQPPNGNTSYGCTVFITFKPTSAGVKTATLTVASDAEGSPQTFQIQGTGINVYPVPQLTLVTPFLRAGTPRSVRLSGSGIYPNSTLLVGGTAHTFNYRTDTYLDVDLSAADLADLGEKSIQIMNPTPGGGASNTIYYTVYIGVKASATDLAYDPYSRKLIFTSPTGAAQNPDSLVYVDPRNLSIVGTTALGANVGPGKLTVSADGKYAYVGLNTTHQIARVDLKSRQKQFAITLANETDLNLPVSVFDIKTVPYDSSAFVATLSRPASPGEAGIVYAKDNVIKTRLQNNFADGNVQADYLVFNEGDPGYVYGDTTYDFSTFRIVGDALTRESATSTQGNVYGKLVTDGRLFFSSNGYKVNPVNPGAPVGRLPNLFFGDLIAENEPRRVFALSGSSFNVYDSTTLQQLDSRAFSEASLGHGFVRWGADGFAFIKGSIGDSSPNDEIIIFRSGAARPYPASSVAPKLNALGISSKPAGSGNLDLLIAGPNFARGAVVTWNGTEVERDYEDGDAPSGVWLVAKIGAAELAKPGLVTIRVTNPGGMQSNALTFRITGSSNSDFDGDGKSDYTVWRPSSGTWFSKTSSSQLVIQQWGTTISGMQDIPVPGDYDGDGKTDIAVWRPSTGMWFIIPSATPSNVIARQWGASGDVLVPADYDGDGKTDIAVWRPSTGTWFIIRSSDSQLIVRQWGAVLSGVQDVPVPADYDGDGKADIAVWRPSTGTWFIIPSATPSNLIVQQWGASSDIAIPADYDGDGKADIAVWRPGSGTWFIVRSTDSQLVVQQWGAILSGVQDVPMPGDFDGDGKADIAVWRPSDGNWYVRPSGSPNTVTVAQWGTSGDQVAPKTPHP